MFDVSFEIELNCHLLVSATSCCSRKQSTQGCLSSFMHIRADPKFIADFNESSQSLNASSNCFMSFTACNSAQYWSERIRIKLRIV